MSTAVCEQPVAVDATDATDATDAVAVAVAVRKANGLAEFARANLGVAYTMPAPKEAQTEIAVALTKRGYQVQIGPHLQAPATLCSVTVRRCR